MISVMLWILMLTYITPAVCIYVLLCFVDPFGWYSSNLFTAIAWPIWLKEFLQK